MAPKAAPPKAGAGPALVEPEEEVQWPEDVEAVPDPPFFCAVSHVVSHVFRLEGTEPGADGSAPALLEFDPCAQLVAFLKEERESSDDPLSSMVVSMDREELQSLADSAGGGSLAKGLRVKLEKEIAARSRRKINTARTKHIAKQHAAAEGESPIEPNQEESASSAQEGLDFVLMLFGCPDAAEDLQQLQQEGVFDIPDMWVTNYLGGQSVREDPPPEVPEGGEPGPPTRVREVCNPPDGVLSLYDAIHGATVGTGLANATVVTLSDCHTYAPPPDPAEGSANPAEEIRSAIVQVMIEKAQRRVEFKEWFSDVQEHVEIPAVRPAEMDVYERLAAAVDPARHDVSLLLHCLTEQVAQTLRGDMQDGHGPVDVAPAQEEDELLNLDEFLEEMHQHTVLGVPAGVQSAPKADEEASGPNSTALGQPAVDNAAVDGADGVDPTVLPALDMAACRHAGDELPGGASVTEAVHRILSHVSAAGIRRSGFPEEKPMSASRRAAKRNRIYAALPDLSVVEIEKLLLLHEFEQLLNKAQPERSWCLKDRVFHERIPRDFLVQVLLDGFRQECFIDTKYMERHDALLIVLYHRALPARMLWHGWTGDLLTPFTPDTSETSAAAEEKSSKWLCTTPGFNDFVYFSAGEKMPGADEQSGPGHDEKSAEKPTSIIPPPSRLLALDARESGYCRVTEKCLTPSDRSVILRTALQRGLLTTFAPPPPGYDLPPAPPEDREKKKEEEEPDELGLLKGLKDEEPDTQADTKKKAAKFEFTPAPRHEMRSVRIVKDGFTFGIVTDEVWAEKRRGFHDRRKDYERAQREAAAAAAEAAKAAAEAEEGDAAAAEPGSRPGTRPVSGVPPEEASGNVTRGNRAASAESKASKAESDKLEERKLENMNLGLFWVAFQDGARCSVRIQHERPWFPKEAFTYDYTMCRPGVRFTYSPVGGLVVQVLSDGSVYQTWPPALRGPGLKGTSLPQALGLEQSAGPLPGGLEDSEVARTVTPFGTVIREMFSGRREVYHADGTVATRNPTIAELNARCESLRQAGNLEEVRYLESLAAFARDVLHGHEEIPMTPPSENAKSLGIPGHWQITWPSGQTYGRFAVPPPKPSVAAPDEAKPEGEAAEGAEDAVVLERAESPDMPLEERMGGVLIDSGRTLEYDIEDVSSTTHIDPHTQQRVTMTAQGLMLFEEHDRARRVCVHADGTRIVWERTKMGYAVSVEKARAARVSSSVEEQGYTPNAVVKVECADGALLEVVPRCLSLKGELVPSDPNVLNPLDGSTNASVLLRRREGTVVNSRGSGDVDIASCFDIAAKGEKEVFSAFDRTGVYTVSLAENRINMRDDDGNVFEVHGDQTVDCKLAVSMGDEYKSPRCSLPGKTYKHPHAEFLPLPEDVPEPRLFIVYGDGESEELLLTRDAVEALRLAKADPDAIVVGPERLGTPMEMCSCYTMFSNTSSDSTTVPARPLQFPPIVAGFQDRSASQSAAGGGRAFTRFRQFIQYPDITDQQLEHFHAERRAQEERERQHLANYLAYGQGMQSAKSRASRIPAKMALAPPTVAPAEGGA